MIESTRSAARAALRRQDRDGTWFTTVVPAESVPEERSVSAVVRTA
ncbi:hypothetical protein [Nocardia wallacei]|nr:hypothetical protein [Nocardia wallacei]